MYWLRLYNLCREFRCLPYPGGVVHQPSEAMQKFEVILTIIREDEENEIAREKAKQRGNRR